MLAKTLAMEWADMGVLVSQPFCCICLLDSSAAEEIMNR